MLKFYLDDLAKGRYDIILGRDILIALVLNINFSEHFMKTDVGPIKVPTAPMVDLDTYGFKYSNTGKFTTKELFMDDYVEEAYES